MCPGLCQCLEGKQAGPCLKKFKCLLHSAHLGGKGLNTSMWKISSHRQGLPQGSSVTSAVFSRPFFKFLPLPHLQSNPCKAGPAAPRSSSALRAVPLLHPQDKARGGFQAELRFQNCLHLAAPGWVQPQDGSTGQETAAGTEPTDRWPQQAPLQMVDFGNTRTLRCTLAHQQPTLKLPAYRSW